MAAAKATAQAGAEAPAPPTVTDDKARAAEFPAKAGHPDTEVDKRSPDGAEGPVHVKEFVLLGRADDPISESTHTANRAAAAHEAIQRGLHPHGEVEFTGATDQQDGRSVTLTYRVPVVPSSTDHNSADTTTPRSILTQQSKGDS
ncbi:hypothetical protein GCM10010193_70500 [Kitasatospora atroaurantiaca]|uniref:Uncharacterized protein n=1 Tax=Kitasatospora atroaurantiaca TaxID=285545 RepID=A0A561ENE2_9ACTN|nr:hypothetical protein [Kitasatospora atroaurantiaca]TWE17135.1 hypothetical protein FB465_2140 [Kitasatospora atroaurantiaca]